MLLVEIEFDHRRIPICVYIFYYRIEGKPENPTFPRMIPGIKVLEKTKKKKQKENRIARSMPKFLVINRIEKKSPLPLFPNNRKSIVEIDPIALGQYSPGMKFQSVEREKVDTTRWRRRDILTSISDFHSRGELWTPLMPPHQSLLFSFLRARILRWRNSNIDSFQFRRPPLDQSARVVDAYGCG